MISEDYKGPVSGRITIGGGPDGAVTRESFTQAEDPVLTKDEANATKWFRELPPNAQLRKVRELTWNLAQMTSHRDRLRNLVREQDTEIEELRRKLARFTPEGFTFPPAARDLLDHATAHGWKTGHAWTVDPHHEGDSSLAVLDIVLGLGRYGFSHLRWACDLGGGGRMTSRGLARKPGRDWHDAPSLKKIKQIITEVTDDQ